MDDDYSDSAMIALLPITSDWCRIECPHMTLVYVGEIKDLKPTVFNELAKDASMLAALTRPITLRVTGRETFGEAEEQVDVFRLQPTPELLAMRRTVEQWNGSDYSDFKPHVTIGPVGTFVEAPMYVAFNRVMVGWGKESLIFSLTN